jgi:hypothetical protein
MKKSTKPSAAQPGIAVDRFAREIVGFLKAFPRALAATECQTVGPHMYLVITGFLILTVSHKCNFPAEVRLRSVHRAQACQELTMTYLFPQRFVLPIVCRFVAMVLVLSACAPQLPSVTSSATDTPNGSIPTVTYCELVHDSTRYNGVTVRVQATHTVGFESTFLSDEGCSEQTWTSLVPADPSCSVPVPTPAAPSSRGGGTRKVTLVGQFHAGGGGRVGYGHLGQYPFQLDVQCIEAAGAISPN